MTPYRAVIVSAVLAALLSACAGAPAETPHSYRPRSDVSEFVAGTLPHANTPIFVGVASRLRDRDEELPAAVLHAAEQAVRYEQIGARYRYVSQRNGAGIGYVEEVTTEWDADRAAELAERAEVRDSLQYTDGTVARVAFDGLAALPSGLDARLGASESPPGWIESTPDLPGMLVGIGVAQRHRTLQASMNAADEEALAALLLQTGTTVRMVEDRRAASNHGTTGMTTTAEEASARLLRFYVASRHVSRDGRYFYSLAIATEETQS